MDYHLLDSWAILAFLWQEQPAANDVRQLLYTAQTDTNTNLLLPIINLGEVYYRVRQKQSLAKAESALALLQQLPLTVLSATDKRVMAAARLKAQYRISYADAFAAGAAIEFDATLWTGDPELLELTALLKLHPLARQSR